MRNQARAWRWTIELFEEGQARPRTVVLFPEERIGAVSDADLVRIRLAPGLTPRSVLEKFATMQMLDMHLPTTEERPVILSRYTHPEIDVQLLLQRLKLELPAQPPPKITRPKSSGDTGSVVKT